MIAIPAGPSARRRNPFDTAVAPVRSLAERITRPPGRSRSASPIRHSDVSGPPPSNVDRYVPGQGRRGRDSRSPAPRREGRRPGARRERGGERRGGRGGGDRADRVAKDGRPRKTQQELDAEMEDYWGAKETNGAVPANTQAEPAAAGGDDIDMIE